MICGEEPVVATMLSAQGTDVKVNEVTADLLSKYLRAEDYVGVNTKDLEGDIRQAEFFRQIADNIRAAMEILVSENDGQVAGDM